MKDFWGELAKRNNFKDEETIKNVYYSLMRLILDQLREEGQIYLPDWGGFTIQSIPPKKLVKLRTKEITMSPELNVVKFKPCTRLKNYVKLLK